MKRILEQEQGSSLLEAAILMPVLLFALAGSVDFGHLFYLRMALSSAAAAGAAYGTQHPSDTAGMISAVQLDGSDVPNLTAAASYGCECADGTLASAACTTVPTCPVNVINYVDIQASYNYSPLIAFVGIPSTFPLQERARMRTAH
ncbi:TadE/TadG family type IV pilus assembly protein [Granulicella tundricola]|uniref:TadE family protein n=1 Tax=Granulicella tundricola (strain ATCC BAA-1859 / DSM 23138 / MP5ACTX9) TaxID=1198114 RepID=E8WYC0_GRATM|nr:TadE family protein [Granulicella tundricola]ADW69826.1 TadE family protein [Granulicella tundricola MP5ACTX9]